MRFLAIASFATNIVQGSELLEMSLKVSNQLGFHSAAVMSENNYDIDAPAKWKNHHEMTSLILIGCDPAKNPFLFDGLVVVSRECDSVESLSVLLERRIAVLAMDAKTSKKIMPRFDSDFFLVKRWNQSLRIISEVYSFKQKKMSNKLMIWDDTHRTVSVIDKKPKYERRSDLKGSVLNVAFTDFFPWSTIYTQGSEAY